VICSDSTPDLAASASAHSAYPLLDDLQWADDASAVLLADVVRQLRGTPMLVFATCRDSAAPGEARSGFLQGLSADANTERAICALPKRRPFGLA
jgi:hypothetical protein